MTRRWYTAATDAWGSDAETNKEATRKHFITVHSIYQIQHNPASETTRETCRAEYGANGARAGFNSPHRLA